MRATCGAAACESVSSARNPPRAASFRTGLAWLYALYVRQSIASFLAAAGAARRGHPSPPQRSHLCFDSFWRAPRASVVPGSARSASAQAAFPATPGDPSMLLRQGCRGATLPAARRTAGRCVRRCVCVCVYCDVGGRGGRAAAARVGAVGRRGRRARRGPPARRGRAPPAVAHLPRDAERRASARGQAALRGQAGQRHPHRDGGDARGEGAQPPRPERARGALRGGMLRAY